MKKLSCFFLFYATVLATTAQVDLTNNGILFITGNPDTLFINGNFTNAASAAFTNNGRFFIRQHYTNQQTSTPAGSGEVILDGTAAQTITTTSTSPFHKLTLNKASGLATLGSVVTVNNTLTLTAGKLSLGDHDLTMGNSANITGAGSNSYLIATGTGELKQQIAALSGKNFPVGTATAYTPVTISLATASTTDVFKVRMLSAVYSNGTSGSQMNSNSVNATWMVSESVNGGSNATLTCQWPASLELTGFNRMFSRVGHYTSSAWDYGMENIAASGSDPYSVSRSGFTSFSPFAVTMSMAILPASHLEIRGKNKRNENIINWSTASEQRIVFYTIESSLNGTDFKEEGKVAAARNSSSLHSYEFTHRQINHRSFYYRIQQVDVDGKIAYSNIIRIAVDVFKSATFYPNPVNNTATVRFNLPQSSFISVTITNGAGLLLYKRHEFFTKGEQKMSLDLGAFSAGTYLLQLTDQTGVIQTFQFIKTN